MIVLAIASVILLGVLLVVPAMNRAGNNSARERDIGSIASTMNKHRASFNRLPLMTATNGELDIDIASVGGEKVFSIEGVNSPEMGYYNQAAKSKLNIINKDSLFVGPTTSINVAASGGANGVTLLELGSSFTALLEEVVIVLEHNCKESAAEAVVGTTTTFADLIETSTGYSFAIIYRLDGDNTILCRDS